MLKGLGPSMLKEVKQVGPKRYKQGLNRLNEGVKRERKRLCLTIKQLQMR